MPRKTCENCLRPVRTCICAFIKPVQTKTRVTILQHPNEHKHSKNTAQLLHLCLPNSQLWVGLDFKPTDLLLENGNNLLLYPDSANTALGHKTQPQLTGQPEQLIVLDGTWRNTRQMLLRNPWLLSLARIDVSSTTKSLYHIRKAQTQYQLSTFEAVCCALEIVESATFPKDALMHPFQQFVEQIARFLPNC